MTRLPICFFLLLLLSSCGKPLQLAFNPPIDFAEHYTMETATMTNSKVMGMDVVVTMEQGFDYTVQRTTAAEAENKRLRFEYTDFNYNMSSMGQNTTYNSSGDPADNDPNLAGVYEAMLNKPWYITYDSEGAIVETEDLDKLLEGAFEDLPEDMRAPMEANFGAEALVSTFQAMTSFYPPKPIKVGDQWPVEQELPFGGMTLRTKTIYTLISRKDGRAELSLTGQVNTDPEGSTLDMGTMKMTYQLTGTQQGTIIVDEISGWPISSQLDQEFGGTVQMSMESMGDMEMEMEMQSVQVLGRKADN